MIEGIYAFAGIVITFSALLWIITLVEQWFKGWLNYRRLKSLIDD